MRDVSGKVPGIERKRKGNKNHFSGMDAAGLKFLASEVDVGELLRDLVVKVRKGRTGEGA